MKFKVYLKDPDGFYESVQDAAKESVEQSGRLNLDQEELEQLVESRFEKANEAISKWVEYSECVTIEFDTDAMTATVLEK